MLNTYQMWIFFIECLGSLRLVRSWLIGIEQKLGLFLIYQILNATDTPMGQCSGGHLKQDYDDDADADVVVVALAFHFPSIGITSITVQKSGV